MSQFNFQVFSCVFKLHFTSTDITIPLSPINNTVCSSGNHFHANCTFSPLFTTSTSFLKFNLDYHLKAVNTRSAFQVCKLLPCVNQYIKYSTWLLSKSDLVFTLYKSQSLTVHIDFAKACQSGEQTYWVKQKWLHLEISHILIHCKNVKQLEVNWISLNFQIVVKQLNSEIMET